MSLMSKIKKVKVALNQIDGLSAYHMTKPASVKAPYAIWQEDSEGMSHYADNYKTEQVVVVTVDYYTQTEYDSMVDAIQDALNGEQMAWTLNSFQYEEETKLMHYEWLIRVI